MTVILIVIVTLIRQTISVLCSSDVYASANARKSRDTGLLARPTVARPNISEDTISISINIYIYIYTHNIL